LSVPSHRRDSRDYGRGGRNMQEYSWILWYLTITLVQRNEFSWAFSRQESDIPLCIVYEHATANKHTICAMIYRVYREIRVDSLILYYFFFLTYFVTSYCIKIFEVVDCKLKSKFKIKKLKWLFIWWLNFLLKSLTIAYK